MDDYDTVSEKRSDRPDGRRFPVENADHAMGLELQIVELVERQTRARVQHREQDAEGLEAEIAQLRAELAATAELAIPGL